MQFESVHTIRDYWDGVRSGTADFNGAPHYFSCPFDAGADDFADFFELSPVSAEFMERELQHWSIFRAWETQFHRGLAPVKTHPGHGGVDAQYDELKSWLDGQIEVLGRMPATYRATFRAVSGQDELPKGVMRELEVRWIPMSA